MGVYEWGMLGGMLAVVMVTVLVSYISVDRKNKALRQGITGELLNTHIRKWLQIFFVVLGLIVLIGGTLITVICSIKIELPTKGEFAILIALMTFTILLCFFCFLPMRYNFVSATEEGVWVRRVFLKPKFFRYNELISIQNNSFVLNGGFIIYAINQKKAFSLALYWETNAWGMVELLQERMQDPKSWGASDIFPL